MSIHPFVNRKTEIAEILAEKPGTLTVLVGVGGTGKTSLLKKLPEEVKLMQPEERKEDLRFLIIDLENYSKTDSPVRNVHRFLSDLAEGLQLGDPIKKQLAESTTLDEETLKGMAGKIQLLISTFASDKFWIVVDTTETLQEQTYFWRFLEEFVVSPLLIDERCRFIFAGRVPMPWRNAEVRLGQILHRLNPLETHSHSLELAEAIFSTIQKTATEEEIERAARLVVKYSCGNPKLTTALANYIGEHWHQNHQDDFEQQMCQQEVKPFIDREFLAGIPEKLGQEWISILWTACVLDWFDTSILARHVAHALPEINNKFSSKPFFYIQGVNDLRLQFSVIWRSAVSGEDQFHDVIGKVMRACLQTLEPKRYQMLTEAAGMTFQEIEAEFSPEDPDAVRYHNEAQHYLFPAMKERV